MPGLFRTSNVVLNEGTFEGRQAESGEVMTLQGTVNKTAALLFCVFAGSCYTWALAQSKSPIEMLSWIWGGALSASSFGWMIYCLKEKSAVLAPIYAVTEGLVIGSVSAVLDRYFPGVVIHAVGLTFSSLAVLLLAYSTGMVRATEKLKAGIAAATGGIVVVYVVDMALRFFGMPVPLINDAGAGGIVVCAIIVAIAAFNLILDFDFVETGIQGNSAKYMEWYGAFGITVTLIWLYFESLRMLTRIRLR